MIIIDIKLINNQMMKVQEVTFNIEDIEEKIKNMKYDGNGLVRDIMVENDKLPSIAEIFYESIFLREIPSLKNSIINI